LYGISISHRGHGLWSFLSLFDLSGLSRLSGSSGLFGLFRLFGLFGIQLFGRFKASGCVGQIPCRSLKRILDHFRVRFTANPKLALWAQTLQLRFCSLAVLQCCGLKD